MNRSRTNQYIPQGLQHYDQKTIARKSGITIFGISDQWSAAMLEKPFKRMGGPERKSVTPIIIDTFMF
jgi:hypothetical protein